MGAGLAFSNHMTCVRFSAAVNPVFAALQLHYLWMAKNKKALQTLAVLVPMNVDYASDRILP